MQHTNTSGRASLCFNQTRGFPLQVYSLKHLHCHTCCFHWTSANWNQSSCKNTEKLCCTERNGSSSGLVKQLEGYYEESVGCTQHWFKCKKLLERDEPAVVGVHVVEEGGQKKKKLLNTWNTLEGSQDQIILKQLNLITNTLWVMTCDAAPKSVTTWMLLVGKKGKTQCSKKRQRDDLWLKIKWEVSTQSEGRAEVAQPLYYYCPGEFLILTEPVFINVKSVLLASQLCQSC